MVDFAAYGVGNGSGFFGNDDGDDVGLFGNADGGAVAESQVGVDVAAGGDGKDATGGE